MRVTALAIGLVLAGAPAAMAQATAATARAQAVPGAADWRTVPADNLMIIDTSRGRILVELAPQAAPLHVERMRLLTRRAFFDGIVFHRVIDGFMAQTGDVSNGKAGGDLSMAGMGGSSKPDLPAEFTNDLSFQRGVVGMARANDPNSANSQFFIMFGDGSFLDGQYTIVGNVVSGMEAVDAIQRGEPPATPDVMTKVTVQD
ncbi:peptidylprolyl isomerase [Brevundimonas sp.]|uniref:peptidylprolyl isomerase n=1 Tax=Brevundimonas sp. TaxID=1871086 RepID=UPI00286B6521|nr:peptidylprolyl isomerase [Brevundimonas sp.]